ncbi:hypothetical protein evm_011835 [Chilo suppressalis]|nr:hypothetical protein evm_011835 [Chilo suppressalis]
MPLVNVHALDSYEGGWNTYRSSRLLSLNPRTITKPTIETTLKVEEKRNRDDEELNEASLESKSQPEHQDITPKPLGIQLPHQRHVLMAKPLPPPSRIRVLPQTRSPEYTHDTNWDAAYTLDTKIPIGKLANNETREKSAHAPIAENPDQATTILLPSRTLLRPLDRSRSVNINKSESDSVASPEPVPDVLLKSISTVIAAENVYENIENKEEQINKKENEMVSQYEPSYKTDSLIKIDESVSLATEEPKVSVSIPTPLPSRQLWLSKPFQMPVVITDEKVTSTSPPQLNPSTSSSFLKTGLRTEAAMDPNKELQIDYQRDDEKQESEDKNLNESEVVVTIPLVLDIKKEKASGKSNTNFNEVYQSELIGRESKLITKTVQEQNTKVNEEQTTQTINEEEQNAMITEKRRERLSSLAPNTLSPQTTEIPKFPKGFTAIRPEVIKNPPHKLRSFILKSPLLQDLESNPNDADSPQLFDYECKNSNGYYSMNNDCDSYIECKKYMPFMFTCPDGLHFNRKAIWPEYPCSYPWEVECQANYRINDPQPTGDCPHRFGVFPLKDDECSKYIMCHEGKANLMSCPHGLVFNTEESACDWPVNVPSCRPKVFQGFTCPAVTEGDEYNFIFKYRYGESCRDYIACQQGKPRLLSCDRGLAFDAESQVCVDADFVENCGTY